LTFDPGERWQYGINLEWTGRIIEATSGRSLDEYMKERVFGPLGMVDSGFELSAAQRSRLARIHRRETDGTLTPLPRNSPFGQPPERPHPVEFHSGGGGLFSTGLDYLTLVRMLLNRGTLGDVRILRPETVALMERNQIGDLAAGRLTAAEPELSNDVDLFPG